MFSTLRTIYMDGSSMCYQRAHGSSMPASRSLAGDAANYTSPLGGDVSVAPPHVGPGSPTYKYYVEALIERIGPPKMPRSTRWIRRLEDSLIIADWAAETLTSSWITSTANNSSLLNSFKPITRNIVVAWIRWEGTTAIRSVQSPAQQRILRASEPTAGIGEMWDEFTSKRSTAVSVEQQFLIRNLGWYSGYNKETIDKMAYKNFLNILGEPQDALAAFISRPNMGPLLRIKPYQRAVCVPKLRLYKVFHPYPDQRAKVVEKELPFHTFTDDRPITEQRGSQGAGLTKATVEYQGINFYSATRELKVQLGFYFQDLNELSAHEKFQPDDPEAPAADRVAAASIRPWDRDPTYLDLVWRPAREILSAHGDTIYNPDHYELKLVIGWSVPKDVSTDIISAELRKSITNMTEVMYLSQLDHTFSFNQDGSAELLIDYRGRVEEALESPRADILYDARLVVARNDLDKEIEETKEDIAAARPGDDTTGLQTVLKNLHEQRKTLLLSDRKERYMNILNRLLKHDSVFYSDVLFVDMKNVNATSRIGVGTVPTSSRLGVGQRQRANIVNATAGSANYNARLGEQGTGVDHHPTDEAAKALWYKETDFDRDCESFRFNYFFFGDLLDVVIEIMRNNHKMGEAGDESMMDDIYYILTSFKYKTRMHEEGTSIPLASIPISLNFFSDWMVKNVLSDQKSTYFLMNFVRDFVKDALTKPFNSITRRHNIAKKNYSVQFGYKVISLPPKILGGSNPGASPSAPTTDGHSEGWKKNKALTVADIKAKLWPGGPAGVSPSSNMAEEPLNAITRPDHCIPQHCVIFYPYTFELAADLDGNYANDLSKGRYHLGLGRNDGIVNEIKFAKSEIAYQAEAEFLKDDRSFGQMKRIYNATVSTMGNTLFYPGSVVFLDPSIPRMQPPVGDTLLARLGLGGYYTVIKVNLELTPQTFETTMTCIWRGTGSSSSREPGRRFLEITEEDLRE